MLQHVRINIVNILYLIIAKIDECFEDINGNKYLVLVPADKSKNMKNSHDYDEKYMKIKLFFDDDLSLKKTLKLRCNSC